MQGDDDPPPDMPGGGSGEAARGELIPFDVAKRRASFRASADTEREIERLAALSPLAYEQARRDAARALGMRPTVLDAEIARRRPAEDEKDTLQGRKLRLSEPEPWPEPIELADVLDDISAALARHVILPRGAADAISLWVVMTFCTDLSDFLPKLFVTAADKQCGKSHTLEMTARFVQRPLVASNISPAALYRVIEAAHPTMMLDEVDAFARDNEELRGLLNSGHSREQAFVIRVVGEDHEARQFSTWAPMLLAGIGRLPATVMDRSIIVRMQRKAPGETTAPFRTPEARRAHEAIRRRIARWVTDNRDTMEIEAATVRVPGFLGDRAADNWRFLLAIAACAGPAWQERAETAARLLAEDVADDAESVSGMLLADIKAAFDQHGEDRITSLRLLAILNEMEHRPWPEWRHGKPMTPAQLARALKPYRIAPGSVRVDSELVGKGYRIAQFLEPWSRYCAAPGSE